jgi:hypothetical protein
MSGYGTNDKSSIPGRSKDRDFSIRHYVQSDSGVH